MKIWLGPVIMAVALASVPGGVRADTLDGGWCYTDGKQLIINGSEIVTPGGNRTTGDYGRHTFTYTIPAREPGAGMTVHMQQLNEETMHLTLGAGAEGAASGPVQTWRRCPKGTS